MLKLILGVDNLSNSSHAVFSGGQPNLTFPGVMVFVVPYFQQHEFGKGYHRRGKMSLSCPYGLGNNLITKMVNEDKIYQNQIISN
ncbi:hypothetical protein [Flagellimonas sp. CMM7]|uniref:hypothetical protein n=1 Tax=Flagellimonas sp. CMM7 TaxID=2654676 RepID=UPI0013D0A49A|nr:hypothetical protein [Flagellimonas sp. CMM7]